MANINEAGNAIANLENAGDRIDEGLPNELLLSCAISLYVVYPAVLETTKLHMLIGISYDTGLCIALVLAYPIYRIIPRRDHHWRGWVFELTHWNCVKYELYVLRVYAASSLLFFLRVPVSTLFLSLGLARLPLSIRVKIPVILFIASVSYLWSYDVLTSAPLYDPLVLSWNGCLWWTIIVVCSIYNAVVALTPLI